MSKHRYADLPSMYRQISPALQERVRGVVPGCPSVGFDERGLHPCRDREPSLNRLCDELVLLLTTGDAALHASVEWSRACEAEGVTLWDRQRMFLEMVQPHGSYVSI